MFSKIKLRANLILSRKKLITFFYIVFLFLLRIFFIASGIFCFACLLAIPLIVTNSQFKAASGYWSGIYIACILLCFFSLFFYARVRIARQAYFDKIIHTNVEVNGGNREDKRSIYDKYFYSLKEDIKLSFRAIATLLLSLFIKIFWLIFYLLPAIVAVVYIIHRLNMNTMAENVFYILLGGAVSATALALIFWFCTIQRYSLMLNFCFSQGANPLEAMRKSAEYTNTLCAAFALFRLSLTPWYLLCIFLIPTIYVVPYSCLSLELFAKKCMASQNKEKTTKGLPQSRTKKFPKIL